MTSEERICMLVRENGIISLEDLAIQMGEAKTVVSVNPDFKEKIWELLRDGKIELDERRRLKIGK